MLLTKDWQLKLTDFGEARAVNLNQVRSASKPRNDSYSFGICLVAMIRGEKDVQEFYFQAIRKTMKRKTKKGVGVTILNNRIYGKGWRPLLPLEFERSYPRMCKLLKRCWSQKKEDRPMFDEIVRVMQGGITEEVLRKEEPIVTVYKDEPGSIYHERMGVTENFGEEEGEKNGADTAKFVNRTEHERLMAELQARIKELEGKGGRRRRLRKASSRRRRRRRRRRTSAEDELAALMGSMNR